MIEFERDYKSIRDEWIHLRKIKKDEKAEVDYIKQAVLGLIVDKIAKLAKADNSEEYDKYTQQAIKSELKQTQDSLKQGVDCQNQIGILEALLPQMLSEEETTKTILAIIARYKKPNVGLIMKDLKSIKNIDMKLASKLVKELL